MAKNSPLGTFFVKLFGYVNNFLYFCSGKEKGG